MLLLENKTPFAVDASVIPDIQGVDALVLAVKATFSLTSPIRLAVEQVPVRQGDIYHGDPAETSLKYANEIHLPKPGTDLVLVGSAHTPAGKPVACLDVSLAVGDRGKVIRVFGHRDWRTGRQQAEPFSVMPLVYERAFGGVGEGSNYCEANPVGVGFPGSEKGGHRPLPNLEDLRDLITGPGSKPRPACFGFVASNWSPRKTYTGTYDEAWQRERAPFLPRDFDARFFQVAHPDLICDPPLIGGEPVVLNHLSPKGLLRFDLPLVTFANYLVVQGLIRPVAMQLETVLFEPDEDRFSMTWRGAYSCDKKATRIQIIHVETDVAVPAGVDQAPAR